jgi:hypothetical protein
MPATYEWLRPYETAILETDRSRLPKLIASAQAAIDARIQKLRLDHQGSPDEKQAIEDALAGLHILIREVNEVTPKEYSGSRRILREHSDATD